MNPINNLKNEYSDASTILKNLSSSLLGLKEDLEKQINLSSKMTSIRKTIEDFSLIVDNWPKLGSITDDDTRTKEINNLGNKAIGLETHISMAQLDDQIQLFVSTYFKAKGKNQLPDFIKYLNNGDPCLTGRIANTINFRAILEFGLKIDEMPDPEKNLFLPATKLSEVLFEINQSNGSTTKFVLSESDKENETIQKETNKKSISSEIVRDYLLNNSDQFNDFVASIQNHADDTHKKNFLEYLETRKLYKKDDKIDWQALIKELVSSKTYFQELYHSAWEQTKGLI